MKTGWCFFYTWWLFSLVCSVINVSFQVACVHGYLPIHIIATASAFNIFRCCFFFFFHFYFVFIFVKQLFNVFNHILPKRDKKEEKKRTINHSITYNQEPNHVRIWNAFGFLLFGVCIFEKLKCSEITSVVVHYVLTSCVSPFVQKGPQIQVVMFHECIAEHCWKATDTHRWASRKERKEEEDASRCHSCFVF